MSQSEGQAIKEKLQNNKANNTGKYTLPDVTIDKAIAYSNFVLVVEEAPREKRGGIIIPDNVKKREWSRVVSVGPNVTPFVPDRLGKRASRKLETGDLVMYYQGVNTIIDGEMYMSIPNDMNNIMVVYPHEDLAEYRAKHNGATPPAPQIDVPAQV